MNGLEYSFDLFILHLTRAVVVADVALSINGIQVRAPPLNQAHRAPEKKEKKKNDAVNFSQSESTGRKILHGEDDGNKSTIPSREDREKLEREKKKEI